MSPPKEPAGHPNVAKARDEASRADAIIWTMVGPEEREATWNDTEAIAGHRAMTPSQRVALAIEISRAALLIAHAERVPDNRADIRA